jgi:hypothetical protein
VEPYHGIANMTAATELVGGFTCSSTWDDGPGIAWRCQTPTTVRKFSRFCSKLIEQNNVL